MDNGVEEFEKLPQLCKIKLSREVSKRTSSNGSCEEASNALASLGLQQTTKLQQG